MNNFLVNENTSLGTMGPLMSALGCTYTILNRYTSINVVFYGAAGYLIGDAMENYLEAKFVESVNAKTLYSRAIKELTLVGCLLLTNYAEHFLSETM